MGDITFENSDSHKQIVPFITDGNFTATPTGLVIDGDPSYEDWEQYGENLGRVEDAIQWVIGDWLNYGERKWGEMYAQATDEKQVETWQIYKYVASNVNSLIRIKELTWSHHREVADLDSDEQEHWLSEALTKNWRVREFKDELRKYKAAKSLPTPTDEVFDVDVIHGDLLDMAYFIGGYDLVIADPPYNVTDWDWDQFSSPQYFIHQTREWLDAIVPHMNDKYHLFWFCSPKFAADIEMVFRILELPIRSRIVWHRRNMAKGSDSKNSFIDSWEMILHSGNKPLNFDVNWDSSRFDVQTFAVPQTNFEQDKKYHPTQKPLELIRWLVNSASLPGESVLDPFAGSGTTGVACLPDRKCTLIEQEGEYVDIIRGRLAAHARSNNGRYSENRHSGAEERGGGVEVQGFQEPVASRQ